MAHQAIRPPAGDDAFEGAVFARIRSGEIGPALALIDAHLAGGGSLRQPFQALLVRRLRAAEQARPLLERLASGRPHLALQDALVRAGFPRPAVSQHPVASLPVCAGHDYPAHVDALFRHPGHPCAPPLAGGSSGPVVLHEFADATLCHAGFGFVVLDRDGVPFPQASMPLLECNMHWFRDLPEAGTIDRLFFDGSPRPGHNSNYCLWFTDHLARICWARGLCTDWPIGLCFPALNGFQAASLGHLGLLGQVRHLRRGRYRVGRLRVMSSSCTGGISRFQGGNPAYARPVLNAFAPAGAPAGRRIFVSRAPSVRRGVTNPAALSALLRDFGFEELDPGSLPFQDQMALFASASHVAGLHGAGLANLLFCHPSAKVLEIFPAAYGTRAFAWIADVKDLDYRTVFVPGDGPVSKAAAMRQDITIPIETLRAALADFVGGEAASLDHAVSGA